MKPIRVVTQDFELLTELDRYTSAIVERDWRGVGELELRINRHTRDAHLLQKGVVLMVGGDTSKVFIIRRREIELDQDGKASEVWNIRAPALKSILSQRLTLPPSHTSYDNRQGPAETVMKHYVERNVVDPDDSERQIEKIHVTDNEEKGETLQWRSRYKNLAEELEDQSKASGMGWNVVLNIAEQRWDFVVLEGKDLTTSQSDNPPVIFSPQFDSLKSMNFYEDDTDYRNAAYVGGQGEGTERRFVEVGGGEGLERYETFVDARDVDEEEEDEEGEDQPRPEEDIIEELENRGERELRDREQEVFLEGDILQQSPFTYETDYDLGDIVTLQNKDWGVTIDARITMIREVYEPDGFSLEAVFGDDRPTLIKKIKQDMKQSSAEVRR
ncbi:siphovirus ReqiPepy6 Gp37-like family protein [Alkalicoccus chagannorensis]|uniref:siphovirus ReqiPepy6 Gp37-like family protein n=1 Tax=Alkalicoccus chagannorensis TaxID=427072 RepID=UPI000479990B|nr:siphovirus ReqiPepy6 Gp37-like family protein [Alkalicoccus chagannorensis]